MKYLNRATAIAILTVSQVCLGAVCVDTTEADHRQLCAQVSISGNIETVGQAVDSAAQLNQQKSGINCDYDRGAFQARTDYRIEVLRDGPGTPNIGKPVAVQLREKLECLDW